MVCSDGDVLRQETSGKVTIHVPGTAGLQIREIAEDRQGNIYVATLRQGLFVMAPQTDRFTHVAGTAGLAINNIYIARNDNIYIGCNGEGLYVYEPATGKLTNNPFFCNRINLSKTKVTSIIEDAEGNIWMSMLQKGVFMHPTRPYEFGYMGFRLGSRNMIGEMATIVQDMMQKVTVEMAIVKKAMIERGLIETDLILKDIHEMALMYMDLIEMVMIKMVLI